MCERVGETLAYLMLRRKGEVLQRESRREEGKQHPGAIADLRNVECEGPQRDRGRIVPLSNERIVMSPVNGIQACKLGVFSRGHNEDRRGTGGLTSQRRWSRCC